MTSPNRRHGGRTRCLRPIIRIVFVDSCMQIWPDADFATAHLHGVTAYGVTAFDPHDTFDAAVERLM